MSNYAGKFIADDPNNPWSKAFAMIKAKTKVLDVGCSIGNFGAALIEHKDCTVDGIEPDMNDATKASKLLRKVVIKSVEDALKNELKSEKYDYIVFLDVIEHLVDPVSTLRSLKDHLSPGGAIVFSIPNMAHISVRLMLLKGEFEYGNTGLLDNTHLHFYTGKEIERIFAIAGYGISEWNFTEAKYSERIIKKELNEVGITDYPSKLAKVLQSDTASIFQYVGCALPKDNVKKIKRVQYSPDPQGILVSGYETAIQALEKENSRLIKHIKGIESEQQRLLKIFNNKHELVKQIKPVKYLYYTSRNYAQHLKKYVKKA